jgi:hypothetical protein
LEGEVERHGREAWSRGMLESHIRQFKEMRLTIILDKRSEAFDRPKKAARMPRRKLDHSTRYEACPEARRTPYSTGQLIVWPHILFELIRQSTGSSEYGMPPSIT